MWCNSCSNYFELAVAALILLEQRSIVQAHGVNHRHNHHQHHHRHHHDYDHDVHTRYLDDAAFCGTRSPDQDEKEELQWHFEQWKSSWKGQRYLQEQQTYVIPLHFTVFEHTDGRGKLEDSEIDQFVLALNEGFKDTPFTFNLMGTKRPTPNDDYFKCDSTTEIEWKTLFRVGEAETLNVFVCNLFAQGRFGVYGVADFPRAEFDARDGVMLMNPTLPKQGVTFNYMEGIITHEVGHWLGLYHTFEGGCEPNQGDQVADTAAHARQTQSYADPLGSCWQNLPDGPLNTCPDDVSGVDPGYDPVDNFMNYLARRGGTADDGIDKGYCFDSYGRFSSGQIERMVMMYETYRLPASSGEPSASPSAPPTHGPTSTPTRVPVTRIPTGAPVPSANTSGPTSNILSLRPTSDALEAAEKPTIISAPSSGACQNFWSSILLLAAYYCFMG